MILVDGHPVPASPRDQERGILGWLLDHPALLAASSRLKATPAASEPVNHVYVFQREYATVDPTLVQLVGTDEATTCVGLVIRNRKNGMTSVGHLDFPKIVDIGISQMLAMLVGQEIDAALDVHLIGGFDDTNHDHVDDTYGSESHKEMGGYSWSLCSKIVEALEISSETFHLQTLCVLGHNTRTDSHGNSCPVISGFLVDASSGSIVPATFSGGSRCPDEIVRRIRIAVSSEDASWRGRLLETYDTSSDRFRIAPCSWMPYWGQLAFSLQQLPDSEIILRCSTSPAAESPDFVENERRIWSYLIKHPDWRQTFPGRRERIFERTADGGWLRSK